MSALPQRKLRYRLEQDARGIWRRRRSVEAIVDVIMSDAATPVLWAIVLAAGMYFAVHVILWVVGWRG